MTPHYKPRHTQDELKEPITLPLKRQNCSPIGLLCVIVPYLVHVVVIFKSHCMTVLLVVLQRQLVKQGTGNRMGTGKEMGLEWDRRRNKRTCG